MRHSVQIVLPVGQSHALSHNPDLVAQVIRLRREGLALAQIGVRFGVTRERVRQIIETQLTPTERDELSEKARRLKSEALQARQDPQGDEVYRLFTEQHLPIPEIGRQVGLSANATRRLLLNKVGGAGWTLAHRIRAATYPLRQEKTYSDEEMLDALRSVHAELGLGDASMRLAEDYNDAARCRQSVGEWLPKGITILIRFDGWSRALQQAGLPHGKIRTKRRIDYRPTEQIVADLFRCGEALGGEIPSVKKYDAWARANGASSEAAVRQRLGSWKAVIDLFLERGEAS